MPVKTKSPQAAKAAAPLIDVLPPELDPKALAAETVDKGGRPRKEIDLVQLSNLAALFFTQPEACAVLNISVPTLVRRMKDPAVRAAWLNGVERAKVSLKRLQWSHARRPDSSGVNMTIHMSKHYLGQTDKAALELSGNVDSRVEVNDARDSIAKKLDSIRERIGRRVAGIAAASGANVVSESANG